MTLQSFLDKIEMNPRGFVVLTNQRILFSNIRDQIWEESMKMDNLDQFLKSIPEGKISWKSYSIGENSLLLCIGCLEHTNDEWNALEKILYKAQIVPSKELLSSIIFLSNKETPLEGLSEKEKTYQKIRPKYDYQTKPDTYAEFKSTIQLPNQLTEKLDKFILTKLDLKNFIFAENNDKIKSSIISLLIDQFLNSTYNYQAEDSTGRDILDITFMSNFPKCNLCDSFVCKHIDIILSDKHILSDLKKNNIIPVRLDFTKFQEEIKDMTDKETKIKNKSKIRKN